LWGALVDASASPRHLSLSLSLYSWSGSAENGARTGLLAGFSRARERGFCHARRRPAAAVSLACARVNSLGCPPCNPWGASEEALSRAYFPRVGSVGPKRRGLVPNPGPRRSLFVALVGCAAWSRGLFERRCHCPSPVVAFEEAPSRVPARVGVRSAERRGLLHAGPRRSLLCHFSAERKCTVCDSHYPSFSLRGEGAVPKQYRPAFRAGLAVSHSVPRPGVVSPDARVRRVSDKTSVRARPYLGVVSRRRVSQKAGIRCESFLEGCSSCWSRCAS
jgi:hypothetical protein